MKFLNQFRQLLSISRSHDIARRYLVVNGFDGALTTLGLLIGFYINNVSDLNIIITACLSAAVALGMSGFSSAYVSEAAERKQEFDALQDSMVTDISGSAHEKASRWIPLLIALVNGVSPFLISLLIIVPLWLAQQSIPLPLAPIEAAIAIAFCLIFLLGVFLSSISGDFWLISGFKTVVVALLTSFFIYLLS